MAGRKVPAADRAQPLIDRVRPSLRRHGDTDRVEAAAAKLLTEGTGAQRQREVFARGGSLAAVVADAVERGRPGV